MSNDRSYQRTATLILVVAVRKLFNEEIFINNCIAGGYFCEFRTPGLATPENVERIKVKMQQIIDANVPVKKEVLSLEDAMIVFGRERDKKELLKYNTNSVIETYDLEGVRDYFEMVPSTGVIKSFDLYCYEEGFILQLPNDINVANLPKLSKTVREAKNWARMLGVDVIYSLNKKIIEGKTQELVQISEALHEKEISDIADRIRYFKNRKVVLIAGPSSSGKTTFAKRLAIHLKVFGITPKLISMDDYFVDREFTPLDENGEYDFESIDAVNTKLFNEHISALVDGKKVEIPTFDFKQGKSELKGNFIQLEQDDVLIVEGIHALNDKASYSVDSEQKFKIYVSALTALNVDYTNRIPTTDVRLIRRIIRDNRYRGVTPEQTLSRWDSVKKGESKNIFPFQEQADVFFNTTLIYELPVLRQQAEALLFTIERDSDYYADARRLLQFLQYFVGIDADLVPQNSLLREFIGGSCFE
ncbi:MAG: phosphoglycerate transporter [Epulopiscium sp. Nele67-Bin004]|nr:MAG: phosphoglycerate transporter [Epulopiscium sp. Nele67-Bin004]